jgi:hypothetical protein
MAAAFSLATAFTFQQEHTMFYRKLVGAIIMVATFQAAGTLA